MSDTPNLSERLTKFIPIVNKFSPTLCLAKWFQTTLYLQTGETHSCYHPPPHKINIKEIEKYPGALHNTLAKKIERQEMQSGIQTKGCQYCWNVENLDGEHISDRHIKTASIFTPERLITAAKGSWDKNVNPEYVEISFGNECNFKCGYRNEWNLHSCCNYRNLFKWFFERKCCSEHGSYFSFHCYIACLRAAKFYHYLYRYRIGRSFI